MNKYIYLGPNNYPLLTPRELRLLPTARSSSEPLVNYGGDCPVHLDQPISIWRGPGAFGIGRWAPLFKASSWDWKNPCVYRTRGAKLEYIEKQAAPTPIETIALDFTRLVDAVENYLSRVYLKGIEQ
jgi:hypothetical protein